MTTVYEFTLDGRIVPAVRMTQRSKWSERAQTYLNCRQSLRYQIWTVMHAEGWDMLPAGVRVGVTIRFEVAKNCNKADIDNLTKTILDSAQGVVFANDNCVDSIGAFRFKSDRGEDNTWLTVRVLE